MSKATILSGGDSGLYRVQLDLDTHRVEDRLTKIQELLDAIDATEGAGSMAALQAAYDAAEAKLTAAIADQNDIIALYNEDPTDEAMIDELKWAIEQIAAAATERNKARIALNTLKLRRASLAQEQKYLQDKTPDEPEAELWCADYSQDLEGSVGLADIANSQGTQLIIRPGNDEPTGAVAVDARDGCDQPSIASTPSGVFANWALRSAATKWIPRYRVGAIVSFREDYPNLCTISLDPMLGDQKVDMNQGSTLEDVPIVYMDCNELVFEVGDRVLVEFVAQDWMDPQIIGFESHPKSCASRGFLTPQGALEYTAGDWYFTPVDGLLYGEIDWRGPDYSLSWRGPKGRHVPTTRSGNWDSKIYAGGDLLATAPFNVYGACISGTYLVCVCISAGTEYVFRRPTHRRHRRHV